MDIQTEWRVTSAEEFADAQFNRFYKPQMRSLWLAVVASAVLLAVCCALTVTYDLAWAGVGFFVAILVTYVRYLATLRQTNAAFWISESEKHGPFRARYRITDEGIHGEMDNGDSGYRVWAGVQEITDLGKCWLLWLRHGNMIVLCREAVRDPAQRAELQAFLQAHPACKSKT